MFLWCVLRALNPKGDHPERVDKELKPKENTLKMEGIVYPVSLKDLNKFEKQNPAIYITVLGYEEKIVYPLRNSVNTGRDHNIILMLIKKDGVKHYCLVKNISRLLSSQATKGKRKAYFCLRCLNPFWCEKSLNEHQEYCNEYEAVKIEMPKKGTIPSLKTITEGKRFLSSSTLILSALSSQCNHVNQTLKVVIPNNTKNTNHLAFVIISNASMMKYVNQN